MKRIGYLFEKIVDKENLYKAIINAVKNKQHKERFKKYIDNIDYYVDHLYSLLVTDSFFPSKIRSFQIIESGSGKVRNISSVDFFPDQVIHHAIMQVMKDDIFYKGGYLYSVASIKDKGTHFGKRYVERIINSSKAKYALKLDIRKYYESIDQNFLIKLIEKRIKDEKVLSLLIKIIKSVPSGIPIGFYSSQIFAEFYLQGLDHFIKKDLGVRYYVRYCDDLLLIESNRRKLLKAESKIVNYLSNYGLIIKPDWILFRIDERPVDFIGYRFYKGKTSLRKRVWKECRKVLMSVKNKFWSHHLICSFMSYLGFIKGTDSEYIRSNYLDGVNLRLMKGKLALAYGE